MSGFFSLGALHLRHQRLRHGLGILGLSDGPADDDPIRAGRQGRSGIHYARLILYGAALGTDAGAEAAEGRTASVAHGAGFLRATHHAITARFRRELGVGQREIRRGFGVPQPRKRFAIQAREHRDRQQLRGAARPAVSLHRLSRSFEHRVAALGMHIHQPRIQGQHRFQRAAHGGGDIVELQIEEDGREGLQLFHEGRALGAKELEPHLQQSHFARQGFGHAQRATAVGQIQGHHQAVFGRKGQVVHERSGPKSARLGAGILTMLPIAPALLLLASPQDAPRPPVKTFTLEAASARVLDAFDLGDPLEPEVPVAPKDRPSYRWLRACATAPASKPPHNPFSPNSAAFKEAEALRAFLALPKAEAMAKLPKLSTEEWGTHLALWRWGKALSRKGALSKAERQAFEDRLLVSSGPDLTQGYALRHALCFALAEKDEPRLGALRTRVPEGQEPLYKGFQAAYGLLGLPLPALRLWTLPGRQAEDVFLGKTGADVWMCPAEPGPLPALPPGTQWVIPAQEGDQNALEPQLHPHAEAEAKALEARLSPAGRQAYFAASRSPFEKLGLVHFPILLRFDAQGQLSEIRMGDAAPKEAGGK